MAQSGMTEVERTEFVIDNYEPGVEVGGENLYTCKTCAALVRPSYFCATDALQRHAAWHKAQPIAVRESIADTLKRYGTLRTRQME